jgi:hypothetical protein
MDWQRVAEKIVHDDQNKWDRKVSSKELCVADNGALELLNGHMERDFHIIPISAGVRHAYSRMGRRRN